jgi:hypothetical protein
MLSDFSDKPLGKIASYLCEKNNPNMGELLMASKFSAELEPIIMDKLKIAPDDRIDIRMFLEKDSILEKVTLELEANGLVITDIQEGPDVIIRGNSAIKDLSKIEAVAEVDRIEHDHPL